jgi:hypothetical protein
VLPTHLCARGAVGIALATALLALASPARAQGSGRGFLFHEPVGSLAIRGGFALAGAGSDIFSFSTDQLTLHRRDFNAPAVGVDLGIRVASRFDVVLGGAYAGSSARSEFRRWVDQNDLPIEQTTSFRRVPVTASVKTYLTPRGRSIGRFAWVPSRYALYAGVGGGAMWYRLRQQGDFVDFNTRDVFPDKFESSGWAPTAHALAGLDFSLSPRFALTAEGKYAWAKANMSEDFSGFDRIDLSGYAATIGFCVRF